MNLGHQKMQKQIDHLYQQFLQHEDIFSKEAKHQLILFLGLTGSGKSTLINYLLGNPLKIVKTNGRYMVAAKQENDDFPKIGNKMTESCTEVPKCYRMKNAAYYLCDTPGYEDTREYGQNTHILTEYFIRKAKSMRAIVVLINYNDMASSKGDKFRRLFQQLSKFTNINEIRQKMLFVYTNVNSQYQIGDLFDQLSAMATEFVKKLSENEDNIEYLKLFDLIFQKYSFLEQVTFEKFQSANIICRRDDLIKEDLKLTLLQMIDRPKYANENFKLKISKQRLDLHNHINRQIILMQKSIGKCLLNFDKYVKMQKLNLQYWSLKEIKEQNKKISLLNDIASNDIDYMQNALSEIKIKLQECLGEELMQVRQQKIGLQTNKPLQFKIDYGRPVLYIQKLGKQGGDFVDQIYDSEGGFYQATFVPQPNKYKKNHYVTVRLFTNKSRQKHSEISQLESDQKNMSNRIQLFKFLQKNESFSELKKVIQSVKVTKKPETIRQYYQSIQINKNEFLQSIPSRSEILIYQKNRFLLEKIAPYKDPLISDAEYDRFKSIPYFNCQQGCAIDFHMVQKPIFLRCSHIVEQQCFARNCSRLKEIQCFICFRVVAAIDNKSFFQQKYKQFQDDHNKYFSNP